MLLVYPAKTCQQRLGPVEAGYDIEGFYGMKFGVFEIRDLGFYVWFPFHDLKVLVLNITKSKHCCISVTVLFLKQTQSKT